MKATSRGSSIGKVSLKSRITLRHFRYRFCDPSLLSRIGSTCKTARFWS